jgi:hypothetical protein
VKDGDGMAQTVEQALAAATLYSDQQEYIVIQLPASAIMAAAGIIAEIGEPFCALIVDKDEVTLIIPAEAWDDFQQRLPKHQLMEQTYRLITFDAVLDPSLIGFMARISQTLTEVKVSILPVAAYSRDHIFVPAQQFDIAMSALERIKSET